MNTGARKPSPQFYPTIIGVALLMSFILSPTPDFLTLIFGGLITVTGSLLAGFALSRWSGVPLKVPKPSMISAIIVGAVVSSLILLSVGASFAEDTDAEHSIVELPRPNSGTFSTKEAEARKSEILLNQPTGTLVAWKNPYNGFSIHIHQDDSITIYGSSGTMISMLKEKKQLVKQSVAEVKKMAHSIPSLGGNPSGILITSDQSLNTSKVFPDVLAAIFVPSIQLFYAHSSEQAGGGQAPTRSESE